MLLIATILGAFIVHELGHLILALVCGLKVKRVGLNWKGPYIVRERGTQCQCYWVAFAGPASNLIIAYLFAGHHCHLFVEANLAIGLLNLFPMPHSDGAHMLAALVSK